MLKVIIGRSQQSLSQQSLTQQLDTMATRTGLKAAKKSELTGTGGHQPLGRAQKRGVQKNSICIERFMDLLDENRGSLLDLQNLEKVGFVIGRVQSLSGAKQVNLLVLDLKKFKHYEASVRIAGAVAFRGRMASKAHLPNCMNLGDIVVVNGGLISGKLPPSRIQILSEILESLSVPFPKKFFDTGPAKIESEDLTRRVEEDDDGFVWDHSGETEEATPAPTFSKVPKGMGMKAEAVDDDDDDSSVDIDKI